MCGCQSIGPFRPRRGQNRVERAYGHSTNVYMGKEWNFCAKQLLLYIHIFINKNKLSMRYFSCIKQLANANNTLKHNSVVRDTILCCVGRVWASWHRSLNPILISVQDTLNCLGEGVIYYRNRASTFLLTLNWSGP